ncbi:MAG: hypothetical protein WA139_01950 [Candidatus Aenigmatarchaeota archaeon]
MASEPKVFVDYRKSLIEKMERNLSSLYETYGKTNGNENCPVLKKAQPMITYVLNKETEAYYSLRKSFMFREAGDDISADDAFEATSQALEESDKATKELSYMMRTECPQKNVSGFYITQFLAKPKETADSSILPVINTIKLI